MTRLKSNLWNRIAASQPTTKLWFHASTTISHDTKSHVGARWQVRSRYHGNFQSTIHFAPIGPEFRAYRTRAGERCVYHAPLPSPPPVTLCALNRERNWVNASHGWKRGKGRDTFANISNAYRKFLARCRSIDAKRNVQALFRKPHISSCLGIWKYFFSSYFKQLYNNNMNQIYDATLLFRGITLWLSSTSSGPFIIIIASIKFLLCSTRTILNDIRRNETKGGIIGDIFYVFTQTSFFRKKCYKNVHVERIINRIRNWLPTERAISNSRGRIVIVTFSSGKTIFPQRGYIQTRFISDNTFT